MMHCVVKKTFTSPLEHIDVEYEQRNLFELTVGKLQKEQLRPGMEPRLLRFVLINNALRTLQYHMMKSDEPPLPLMEEQDEIVESFICNTFKDGGLSLSPQSPPTPIKVKTLGSLLSDLSPLVASTGVLDDSVDTADFGRLVESVGVVREEGGACEAGDAVEGGEEKTVLRGCLGKHSLSEEEFSSPKTKRLCSDNLEDIEKIDTCKPINGVTPSINGTLLPLVNGIHAPLDLLPPSGLTTSPFSDTDSEDESSTLSPIDFTKVDPTLYGFDLSADPSNSPILSPSSNLPLFTPAPTTHSLTSVSHGPTVITVPIMTKAQPSSSTPLVSKPIISIEPLTSKAAQTDSPCIDTSCKDSPCKNGKFSGSMEGIVSTQNGHLNETTCSPLTSTTKLGCSREGTPENDFFEDLVSLLIT